MSGVATERKSTYAAAEAGLDFYLNRLQHDPDYWTKCDTGAAAERHRAEPGQPAVGRRRADPRRWRTIPGATDQYTIELVPAPDFDRAATPTEAAVVHGHDHGHVQDPRHRPRRHEDAKRTRSDHRDLPARQLPQLRLLHQLREPRPRRASPTRAERTRQQNNCADKLPHRARTTKDCPEISFATGDKINGPLHTNDESLLICGTPTFGRPTNQDGTRRATEDRHGRGPRQPAPGHVTNPAQRPRARTPRRSTRRTGGFTTERARCSRCRRATRRSRRSPATAAAYYKGKTLIRLRGTVDGHHEQQRRHARPASPGRPAA